MGFWESSLFYLVAGLGVTAALLLHGRAGRPGEQAFRAASAVLFWPLYLPLLLSLRNDRGGTLPASSPRTRPPDRFEEEISRAERELEAALAGLDGWAEDVLLRERGRLDELFAAFRAQAERIRQMDRVLSGPVEAAPEETASPPAAGPDPAGDRLSRCEESRRRNLARLRDLLGTLAWVRELVSMIHLAKFTGAPAERAEELVGQIAAAVEGLSAVSGLEDPSSAASGGGTSIPEGRTQSR